MRLKVVRYFYTHFYTFVQRGLERRMDNGFLIACNVIGCTFNPFVVGSTPARPTKVITKTSLSQGSEVFFVICKFTGSRYPKC
jgi:hypothetical protein